jgi:hypothetical protein
MTEITIVTGYFSIPSKFSNQNYWEWIKNFLSLNCHLIIFTDEENFSKIKNLRKSENTLIIKIRISDFVVYDYLDYWKYCKKIDREEYHTPELYMIWAEKTFFLKRAIDLNPFNSNYFFWSDIGCIRDSEMLKHIQTFPNIQKFSDYDLCNFFLSLIEPFQTIDKILTKDKISITHRNIQNDDKNEKSCKIINRIQGGFFGGNIKSCLEWVDLYIKELALFITTKTFGGKDQYIFNHIYLKNSKKFNLLSPITYQFQNIIFNEWFSYLKRFS